LSKNFSQQNLGNDDFIYPKYSSMAFNTHCTLFWNTTQFILDVVPCEMELKSDPKSQTCVKY